MDPELAEAMSHIAQVLLHRTLSQQGQVRITMADIDAYEADQLNGAGLQLGYDEATGDVTLTHRKARDDG